MSTDQWHYLATHVPVVWLVLGPCMLVLLLVGTAWLSSTGWAQRRLSGRRMSRQWPVLAHECGLTLSGWSARTSTGSADVEVIVPFWISTIGHRFGFVARFALLAGQTVEGWQQAGERIAVGWGAHRVLIRQDTARSVAVTALIVDPLAQPVPLDLTPMPGVLAVPVGCRDDGSPWVLDLAAVPHWLVVGATGSGKSTLLNALVCSLAPRPVALVGIDFKGGVELAPYAPRLSRLAVDRAEALPLLRALVRLADDRRTLLRECGARSVWDLDDTLRPVPVVLVVDEVAELFLDGGTGRAETSEIAGCSSAILRLAQQGRALGIHLVVCGQRVSGDLGKGVTALRAQLSGRVCLRVNDPDTARMCLSDVAIDAVHAAERLDPTRPGLAVVSDAETGWAVARGAAVTLAHARQAAEDTAGLRVPWEQLVPASGHPVVAAGAADIPELPPHISALLTKAAAEQGAGRG